MSKFDESYHLLLRDILENGVTKKDRTGTGTISVFGRQLSFDTKYGSRFPLLTTKKLHTKSIIHELIWFLQGNTNIKYLVNNGVSIWNEWPYKKYLEFCKTIEEPDYEYLVDDPNQNKVRVFTIEEFAENIKANINFAEKFGDLGRVYGAQWRKWDGLQDIAEDGTRLYFDQIQILVNDLKQNPDSRRLMVTAWNPMEIHNVALPPCHYGFQVWTKELTTDERLALAAKSLDPELLSTLGKGVLDRTINLALTNYGIPKRSLSLMWNQRSVDTFLGLPFNIASYGFLLYMLAQQTNMIPDILTCSLGDTHLYSNHIEYVQKQLERDPLTYNAPTLSLTKASDIFSYQFDNFLINNYEYYPNWKNVPIAV